MIEKLHEVVSRVDHLIDAAADETLATITINTSPRHAVDAARTRAHCLLNSLGTELMREHRAAPPAALPWVKIVEGGPRPPNNAHVMALWESGQFELAYLHRDGGWRSAVGAAGIHTPTHYLVITPPEV